MGKLLFCKIHAFLLVTVPKRAVVAQFAERSAPDRRALVRGSPNETSPHTVMAIVACEIRRRSKVLQDPIQIIPLGYSETKLGANNKDEGKTT